jgi:GntR family transcriptional regulator
MYVNPGARAALLESERRKFLGEEWPTIQERIERLGLTKDELLRAPPDDPPPDSHRKER